MIVADLLAHLEQLAPASLAFSFDRIGLQIGSADWPCGRIAVSLDSSLGAVDFARTYGANVLLSHHPLIWDPLKSLDPTDSRVRAALELAQSKTAFVAAHTNWDCAADGLNDELARRLGLTDVQPFGSSSLVSRYKVTFSSSCDDAAACISRLNDAGAEITRQSKSWEVGLSAGSNSDDHEDVPPQDEKAKECRIELNVEEPQLNAVLAGIHGAHHSQKATIDIIPLVGRHSHPAGRLGRLDKAMSLEQLCGHVDECLGTTSLAWRGHSESVEWVAVVGGAADGEWQAAQRAGAQAFVTGEIKQNNALAGAESGLSMIAAGHYATEQPGCEWLCHRLNAAGFDAMLYAPIPGDAGRPLR